MKGTVIIDEYSGITEKRSTLTIKDLEDASRRAAANRAPAGISLAWQNAVLYGMSISEVPARYEPVLKLCDAAPVSDAFREEMNAYLLDLFGTRDVSIVPLGQIYAFGGNAIMRPEMAALLRSAAV